MDLKNLFEMINENYKEVLQRFMNNENFFKKFLKKFQDDMTFSRLSEAVRDKEYKDIEKESHTLKGLSANLGFQKLSSNCSNIVASCREGNYDAIESQWIELQNEYMKIVTQLAKLDE